MRGIAALVVASHHGLTAFATSPGDWLVDLLGRMTNPGSAVLFFFVLSGYVLGQSIERDPGLVRFLTRRAFRILPAFVASVLFAYACVTLIRIDPAPASLTEFFKRPFWPEPTLEQMRDNLLLQSFRINGPTWSIDWEILGSIYLPFLVYLHRGTPTKYHPALFLSACCLLLLVRIGQIPLLNAAMYFYAGYFLPPMVARFMPRLWLARAAVFGFGYWLNLSVGTIGPEKSAAIIPASIACSLMIGAVLSSDGFLIVLRSKPLRFLGRVSYSFYLLHWPLFYITTLALISAGVVTPGALGNWVACICSIALALGLSALSYRWVEIPSISAGKRLVEKVFAPSRVVESVPTAPP